MTPHWKFLHDGWIQDFRDWQSTLTDLKLLLRKHPDDGMTECFKSMIGAVKNKLKRLNKEYKNIYCGKVEL